MRNNLLLFGFLITFIEIGLSENFEGLGVESLKIKEIKLLSKKDFLNRGKYERIIAAVNYIINPEMELNKVVTDIDFAKKNTEGKVEYQADLVIIKPVDMRKSNGCLIYEVVNRGNIDSKIMEAEGWDNSTNTPQGGGSYSRLLQQGYVLVFSGWQGDIAKLPNKLKAYLPYGSENNKPLDGQMLYYFYVDQGAESHEIGEWGTVPYPVDETRLEKAVLRKHNGFDNQGLIIDSKYWNIEVRSKGKDVVKYRNGFPQGYYSLTYSPSKAPIMGLGFTAVRDLIDYLRSNKKENPLRSGLESNPIKYAFARGQSQCGRFLNTYLNLGFNRSLSDSKIFDGIFNMLPGCRRIFLNYRFAQPSRYNGFYPNFDFPLSYTNITDPVSGQSGSLLNGVTKNFMPKMMVLHNSAEYWSSGSAFTHLHVNGKKDLEIPESLRIYHISGTPHGAIDLIEGKPKKAKFERFYLNNPNDSSLISSPLFDQLVRWVVNGNAPEPSRYPSLKNNQLVSFENFNFPESARIKSPDIVPQQFRYNFGKRFKYGILDKAMPDIGMEFPLFIPKVDQQGNEVSGIKSPWVAVPIASYTGWNFSRAWNRGNPAIVKYQSGAWVPFASTKKARMRDQDERLSLEELYGSKKVYLKKLNDYCEELIEKELLFKVDKSKNLKKGW